MPRERRPSGRAVVNAHSPSGLLLSARFWAPGAAAPAEERGFRHDACGRVVSARDGEGESTYAYDPCGRPTRETRAGSGRAEYAVSTSWNRAGLRTQVVDPGKAVKYDWDLAGRLRFAGEVGRETTYAHDRRGDKIGERSAAGLEQRWERDLPQFWAKRCESVGKDKRQATGDKRDALPNRNLCVLCG